MRAAPRADPDERFSRIRLLARVIAASVGAVCHSAYHTVFPALRPVYGSWRMALPSRRCLPSIPSASVQTDLFGDFAGTTQRSDCQDPCIVGDSCILPDAVCAGLLQRIAPWQTNPGSPDSRTRCVCACPGLRPRRVPTALARTSGRMLSSVRWDHVDTRKLHPYFGTQYWACTSPVNASLASLPPPAHDSGPGRLAKPSLLGTCTPSTMPVLIGAPQRFGVQPVAG